MGFGSEETEGDELSLVSGRSAAFVRVVDIRRRRHAAALASCGSWLGGPVACVDHLSEWTAARMAVMASGSRMAEMTRILPPQKGHLSASIAHTLIRRSAQLMRLGRLGVTGTPQRGQGGKPGGVGTIAERRRRGSLEFGAAGPVRRCHESGVGACALRVRAPRGGR